MDFDAQQFQKLVLTTTQPDVSTVLSTTRKYDEESFAGRVLSQCTIMKDGVPSLLLDAMFAMVNELVCFFYFFIFFFIFFLFIISLYGVMMMMMSHND